MNPSILPRHPLESQEITQEKAELLLGLCVYGQVITLLGEVWGDLILLENLCQGESARDGSNWYAYVNNNPLNRVDPSGLFTWFIPGTFNGGEEREAENPDRTKSTNEWEAARDYFKSQDNFFPERTASLLEGDNYSYNFDFLGWSGGNTDKDRRENILSMADSIEAVLKENPKELINLVGHSHGGNVAKLLSDELGKRGHSIENLVLLSTPVRKEYDRKQNNVKNSFAIFSDYDQVKDGMANFDGASPKAPGKLESILSLSSLFMDFLPKTDSKSRNYRIGTPHPTFPINLEPFFLNEYTKKPVDFMEHVDTLVFKNIQGGLSE